MRMRASLTVVPLLLLAGAASAESPAAKAGIDMNLRSGPSMQDSVVGVIPQGAGVSVNRCTGRGGWCEVAYKDLRGWAYGGYLRTPEGAAFVPPAAQMQDGQSKGGQTQASVPARAAAAAPPDEPPAEVRAYVAAHPQPEVILDGDLVLGAGVPANVALHDLPRTTDTRYVNINGQHVLVGPDRRVRYIFP